MDLKEALTMLNECGTNINDLYESEVLDVINKSLTPPTEEEVCKALSEYYGGDKVVMTKQCWSSTNVDLRIMLKGKKKYHLIAYRNSLSKCCNIIGFLPPHLITLIGRFYEGLINND